MFNTHNINSNRISIRNLILLFLTIVFGFASVITLADIQILSEIGNARQTIAHITVTSDGTDDGELEMEIYSWGIYINTGILESQTNFSWKVLGIDDEWYLIYTDSDNLVVWGGDGYWTGDGNHIRNVNKGNVGIWASPTSGKLHIVNSGSTDIYIEEQAPTNAASLRLLTPIGVTWIVGGDSDPNVFFIGTLQGAQQHQEYFAMDTWGNVGIGTTGPKADMQVVGNFIGWDYSNDVIGANSSIAWGTDSRIEGSGSFIWWGGMLITGNKIFGDASAIAGGNENTINGWESFIGWGHTNFIGRVSERQGNSIVWWRTNTIWTWTYASFIGWGVGNTISLLYDNFIWWGENNIISGGSYNHIWWGSSNQIYVAEYASINWGQTNKILWESSRSVIPWGKQNYIDSSIYSFAAWYAAQIKWLPHTFVRNSATTAFGANKQGTFLINVPWSEGYINAWWVGINTDNPKAVLDVSGSVMGHSFQITKDEGWTICDTNNLWKITRSGDHFYGCNSLGRKQLDN